MKKSELKNTRQFKEAMRKSEQARKDGNERPFQYMNNVPLFWCVQYDITTLELFTYCFVRDCTRNMKERAFTGSIKGLCARFNTSAPTQRRALENLVEKGFLRKEKSPYGQAQWVRYVDALQGIWLKGEDRDTRSVDELLDINVLLLKGRRSRA